MTHDNVTDIEARLRRNSDDCSGHEPSLSLLQRTAEEAADTIATLRKQLENAREALRQVLADEMQVIDGYERNGPSFTSPDTGFEYYEASYVLDAARERVATIDEALKGQPC